MHSEAEDIGVMVQENKSVNSKIMAQPASLEHPSLSKRRHKIFWIFVIITVLTYAVSIKVYQVQLRKNLLVIRHNNSTSNTNPNLSTESATISISSISSYSNNKTESTSIFPFSANIQRLTPFPLKQQDNKNIVSEKLNTDKSKSTKIIPSDVVSIKTDLSHKIKFAKLNTSANINRPTQACKIPKLNPYHPSILNITKENVTSPKCGESYDMIFDMDIKMNESTLIQIRSPKDAGFEDCCYKLVYRIDESDNSEKFSNHCYPITKPKLVIPQNHEFIAIFCNSIKNSSSLNKTMIDAFALTPLKPLNKTLDVTKSEQVNLVVLGLDGVSHMNFQRTMSKVFKYLISNLSAFWMDGYSKVGDNTYPNLLAMLSNQNHNESVASCSKNQYFDDCPMIWKQFAQRGYRTSFGEDSPWMGAFTYRKQGFKKAPTDYYLRPMNRIIEKYIKSDQRANAYICYGPRLSFAFLLNYMKTLATTMGQDKRYFQFLWATSLTHDYVNNGRLGEALLLEFLQWMNQEGYLNNTVFVLMSDHGIRWGPIRKTQQGAIEENMPFLYFVFPPKFRNKYTFALDNFLTNKNRLTTPFDTYQTFLDILDLKRIENDNINVRSLRLHAKEYVSKTLPRGISLFLPISENRTCEAAEIAEHWCICEQNIKNVSVTSEVIQQAGNYIVFTLNSFISTYSKCAFLAINYIRHAYLLVSPTNDNDKKMFKLSISTVPGHANFEVTLVQSNNTQWSISGEISRTNLYGNQSYCIDDRETKKYCYCLD